MKKIKLTEAEKDFITPLIRQFRLGEAAMNTLRRYIRLKLRQNNIPDSTNASLDMDAGDAISVPEEIDVLSQFPLGPVN